MPTPDSGRLGPRWSQPFVRSATAVLLALVPFLIMGKMVKRYVVNTPFYDDWTFQEDWLGWREGTLKFADLFTAHMEHRVTVARMLALIGHWLGGSDLRWQNGFTIALLLGSGWNLLHVLRLTTGKKLEALRLPLFLMSATLFCTIQWQGLLWPILFEAYIPLFACTVMMRLWLGQSGAWTALGWSLICCFAGSWSFATGLVLWPLIPLLVLGCRPDLRGRALSHVLLAWLVGTAIAAGLYMMNFTNAVAPQFAYGQGHDVTVEHSMSRFLRLLPQAPAFIMATLGSHLSRGLHLPNLGLAQSVGGISLALFGLLIAVVWKDRRDGPWVRSLVPWICLGLLSIGSAALIAAGRIGQIYSQAISVRYISHAIPLTVAIIAGVWIARERWLTRLPHSVVTIAACTGGFLVLLTTQWIYGTRMMELWSQTRWQGRAFMLFAKLYPSPDALSILAGDGEYLKPILLRMDKLEMTSPVLLDNLKLKQFTVVRTELPTTQASFDSLELRSSGEMQAEGYAELPNHRPADLILFTRRRPSSSEEMIFGVCTTEGVPTYLEHSSKRDHEWLLLPTFLPDWTARWTKQVFTFSRPEKDDIIDAWALDAQRMRVYRIDDRRLRLSRGFPKSVFPNSDPK